MLVTRALQRRTGRLKTRRTLISTVRIVRANGNTPTRGRHKRRILLHPIRSLTRLIPMISLLRQRLLRKHAHSSRTIMIIILRIVRHIMRLRRIINNVNNLIKQSTRRISTRLSKQLQSRTRSLHLHLSLNKRRIRRHRIGQTGLLLTDRILLRNGSTLLLRSTLNKRAIKSISKR